MQKKVWAIVKGTDIKPSPGDDNLRDWLKDEQLAAGVIYLGLVNDQKSQVEDYLEDPKKMWEELESIHVQKRPSTRFNAYNSLLSISKQEQESLLSLTARIEKGMQEIKNLRPQSFTIDDLDKDLMSMAMVRALPQEYSSFVSSLILLPQFDFKTLKEAFILEESNRRATSASTSVTAVANLARVSNKCTLASKSTSKPPPPSPKLICEFCQTHNHSQDQCRLYKQFQQQATTQAMENRSKCHHFNSDTSSTPSNTKSLTPQSSQNPSKIQDGRNVEEFAGNASISSKSLSPQFSLSLCWCADTGASSYMTPHRAWFEEYEPYSIPIRVADGTVVNSAGIGSIHFQPRLQGIQCQQVVFHRVLHVPQLQNNLLSVLYLTSKEGFRVVAENQSMFF
jgi:gag-polypeptide of LTR copia-type